MEEIVEEVVLEEGKYTFQLLSNGTFRWLRYGQEWQDLSGNKAVFALFQALQEAKRL